MAKSNLALDERADTSRPTLRRQLAKNNFDLDTQDLQTLAMALESKYQKDNEKAPGETPSTPKKKKNGKAKAKSKSKAHAKPPPRAKAKEKPRNKKLPRRHPLAHTKQHFATGRRAMHTIWPKTWL